jgi:hypothetical protein
MNMELGAKLEQLQLLLPDLGAEASAQLLQEHGSDVNLAVEAHFTKLQLLEKKKCSARAASTGAGAPPPPRSLKVGQQPLGSYFQRDANSVLMRASAKQSLIHGQGKRKKASYPLEDETEDAEPSGGDKKRNTIEGGSSDKRSKAPAVGSRSTNNRSDNASNSTFGRTQDVFSATVTRFTANGGSSTTPISLAQLEAETLATMRFDVLPAETADNLLNAFMVESERWKQGARYMFDRKIAYERLSTGFPIAALDGGGWSKRDKRWEVTGFIDEVRYAQKVVAKHVRTKREKRRMRAMEVLEEERSGSHADRGSNPAHGVRGSNPNAAARVGSKDGQRKPHSPYPPRLAVASWDPNYCIANLYRTGEDFTGIHSDPLTQLGPQCIIASVSLGAARLFKLKPAGRKTNKKEVTAAEKVGVASCYTLRLPHNSLVVMWEGCQEHFRHEVPKESDKTFPHHDKSGAMRLNLTFRHRRFAWSQRAPLCGECSVDCLCLRLCVCLHPIHVPG